MENRKNILLIMTDEYRLDYTGYSGAGKMATPNIDRIAESCGFLNCQSTNPICAPARTSMATGRYPHQIGTLAMLGDLSQQVPTFMQALQKEGYYTAASGKLHYMATWGSGTPKGKILDLVGLQEQIKKYGFDDLWETAGKQLILRNYCEYAKHLEEKGMLDKYIEFVEQGMEGETGLDYNENGLRPSILPEEDYIDVLTCDKAIHFLENRPKDKPFYLYTSFCGPHMPFDAPKSWLDKVPYEEIDDFIETEPLTTEQKKQLWKKRQAYKAMILCLDHQVGRLLDYLTENGLLEDTVILFTSDHGEMLGDHYLMGKSVPWKESCTVPLAIRHPDYLNRQLNRSPVSLLDVAATVLDAAGIEPSALKGRNFAFSDRIPSRSLLPVLKEELNEVREFTFTEFGRHWQMLESTEWKYIRWINTSHPDERIEELYDKSSDPQELHNLAGQDDKEEVLNWFRRRREYELDHTQPIQTFWAPLNLPLT